MPFLERDGLMQVRRAAPVAATVRVPGSKSLTNRTMLLAALAEGRTRLVNPLHSDDTHFMRSALQAMGCAIDEQAEHWDIEAPARWRDPAEPLFIGNAGTAMRFLVPAMSAQAVRGLIGGNERMAQRPIADLVEGLRSLGAGVSYQGREGYPPLRLDQPLRSGSVAIRGDASSQYVSGLLMALPLLAGDSLIQVTTPLVSRTYVEMTLACMAQLGVGADAAPDYLSFRIPGNQRYQATTTTIEPDASTASYWFALPLMVGGSVTVRDVPAHSHQGDFGLLDHFAAMGADVQRGPAGVTVSAAALRGVDVDMNTRSDVAPTLAVVATLADSPTLIRNVGNMRIKECDRIACIQQAFDALGLHMESGPDWMRIHPSKPTREAVLQPEEDHRMAMIFALLGLAHGCVHIAEPACVAKTYPAFFHELGSVLTPR